MLNTTSLTLGRVLLGLYFLLPGLSKIPQYDMMLDYMALHQVPMVNVLLPLTIVLQVGGGLMLIFGYRIREAALTMAVLTVLINLGMHDFWNSYPNTDAGHEIQNFVKNMGIFAGLLVLSASAQVPQWRWFRESK